MNRIELLEIEIESLKDRLYNLELYVKSITNALNKWSDNLVRKIKEIEEKNN